MTLNNAKLVLRIDTDDNNELIYALLDALPGYIEVATGYPADQQSNEPMIETVSGFIMRQWYYADHADDIKLQRVIDSLLKAITIKAKAVIAAAAAETE